MGEGESATSNTKGEWFTNINLSDPTTAVAAIAGLGLAAALGYVVNEVRQGKMALPGFAQQPPVVVQQQQQQQPPPAIILDSATPQPAPTMAEIQRQIEEMKRQQMAAQHKPVDDRIQSPSTKNKIGDGSNSIRVKLAPDPINPSALLQQNGGTMKVRVSRGN